MAQAMTAAELREFLRREFPQVSDDFTIEEAAEGRARVRLNAGETHLRPGGTVSGPAMFALADVAMYIAVLSMIGPKALAVTTNCSIDFMRRPAPGDLLAEAWLLKLGRQLAVGDVLIHASDAPERTVARASMTYSIPPKG